MELNCLGFNKPFPGYTGFLGLVGPSILNIFSIGQGFRLSYMLIFSSLPQGFFCNNTSLALFSCLLFKCKTTLSVSC